jgi:hypothetical protein
MAEKVNPRTVEVEGVEWDGEGVSIVALVIVNGVVQQVLGEKGKAKFADSDTGDEFEGHYQRGAVKEVATVLHTNSACVQWVRYGTKLVKRPC